MCTTVRRHISSRTVQNGCPENCSFVNRTLSQIRPIPNIQDVPIDIDPTGLHPLLFITVNIQTGPPGVAKSTLTYLAAEIYNRLYECLHYGNGYYLETTTSTNSYQIWRIQMWKNRSNQSRMETTEKASSTKKDCFQESHNRVTQTIETTETWRASSRTHHDFGCWTQTF